ncbi:hypothetical protein CEXT_682571 [Caerostris extrusa]|uniref:Uncharacterized protein n=1 Tax=Caerostris extrusa TaxID=172846 RepID=A0AAV4T1H8_CAEEX|nr:hypothetical protein CEXT_682571 [Caerostris extrusa]
MGKEEEKEKEKKYVKSELPKEISAQCLTLAFCPRAICRRSLIPGNVYFIFHVQILLSVEQRNPLKRCLLSRCSELVNFSRTPVEISFSLFLICFFFSSSRVLPV